MIKISQKADPSDFSIVVFMTALISNSFAIL